MRLFDSHAHLSDARFAQDRDEMIRGLAARGVEGVIECATDAADIEEVAALAETYGNVYAAVGIHPHSCDEFTPEVAARLRQLYAREKVVAIGEIGLDYHYDFWEMRKVLSGYRAAGKYAGRYAVFQYPLEAVLKIAEIRRHFAA